MVGPGRLTKRALRNGVEKVTWYFVKSFVLPIQYMVKLQIVSVPRNNENLGFKGAIVPLRNKSLKIIICKIHNIFIWKYPLSI